MLVRKLRKGLKRNLLKPIADTVRRRKPDFFILGGTRCGSTTLHFLLKQHPDLFMTRKQELQFFNHDSRFRGGLRDYTRHFSLAPRGSIAADVTPMYMHKGYVYDRQDVLHSGRADDAVVRIARLLPDAKIVLSLRNPVERMVSEYKKNRNQGKHDVTLMELLAEEEGGIDGFGYLHSNRYDIHLAHVLAHFPREQVHVMIFEEWTQNLPESLLPLHRFLGVEPRADVMLPGREASNSGTRYHSAAPLLQPGDADLTDEKRAELAEKLRPAIRYVEDFLGRPVPW